MVGAQSIQGAALRNLAKSGLGQLQCDERQSHESIFRLGVQKIVFTQPGSITDVYRLGFYVCFLADYVRSPPGADLPDGVAEGPFLTQAV